MSYIRNQDDKLQITYDRERKEILAVDEFDFQPPKFAGSFFITGTRKDLMAFFTGRGYETQLILDFTIND